MFIARGKLSKVTQINVLLYLDIHPTTNTYKNINKYIKNLNL